MPSIASRLDRNSRPPDNIRGSVNSSPSPSPSLGQAAPILSTILRSPLPNIGASASPDNLRQYYAGGMIPQYRLVPVAPLSTMQRI